MRASWSRAAPGIRPSTRRDDYLSDALTLLAGWTRDEDEITRTLPLDDAEHAALTERIKVVADALQVQPEIRRTDGQTRIRLSTAGGGGLTAGEVTMAARIEDAYRTITSDTITGDGAGNARSSSGNASRRGAADTLEGPR
jgi:4a-hydroxytetrahydrobiopterin dehydratase